MAHRHKASVEKVSGYRGGITQPDGTQEPRAAGGIRVYEECRCGATRTTNRNGKWRETSGWVDPSDGSSNGSR